MSRPRIALCPWPLRLWSFVFGLLLALCLGLCRASVAFACARVRLFGPVSPSLYLRAFVPLCFRLRASVPSCLRAFVPSCLRASAPLRLRAFVPLRLRALFASGPVSGVLFRCSGSVCASPCLLSLVGAPLLFVSLRLRFPLRPGIGSLGIWELVFSDWFLGLAFWIGFFEIFLCILLCVYNEFFFFIAASPSRKGPSICRFCS